VDDIINTVGGFWLPGIKTDLFDEWQVCQPSEGWQRNLIKLPGGEPLRLACWQSGD
jgi:hypothetical protein